MVTVKDICESSKLPGWQILQLVRALPGFDPLPPEDTTLPPADALTIWTASYLATMGLLNPMGAHAVVPLLHSRISTLGDDPAAPAHYDAACIRLADRRYLLFDNQFVDLQTGHVLERLPVRPVEKTIIDVGALYQRKTA